MGSFKDMMYLYRTHKQIRDIELFARCIHLSFEDAATIWCENGCAKYWNQLN